MSISELVENNPNIEEKEYILELLKYLETIIPEDNKNNFYNNISKCIIKLNLNEDISNIEISEKDDQLADYDIDTNTLEVSKEGIKILSTKLDNEEEFNNYFWHNVLHELSHMASTTYEDDKCLDTGVMEINNEEIYKNDNTAINEGIAEYIANGGIPIEYKNNINKCYIEYLIIEQISTIIGNNIILNSYFGNKGINGIKQVLDNIIKDDEIIDSLFGYIEANYEDQEKNLLPYIETTLVTLLFKKLILLIEYSNLSKEELEDLLNTYETYLITPEILKENNLKINNEPELIKVIERYYKNKENLLNRFSKTR